VCAYQHSGTDAINLVGGQCYLYIVVDDHTCAVYTHLLHLKSEATDAFKTFKVAVEKESGKKIKEVMTDNVCKLSMGKMSHF